MAEKQSYFRKFLIQKLENIYRFNVGKAMFEKTRKNIRSFIRDLSINSVFSDQLLNGTSTHYWPFSATKSDNDGNKTDYY